MTTPSTPTPPPLSPALSPPFAVTESGPRWLRITRKAVKVDHQLRRREERGDREGVEAGGGGGQEGQHLEPEGSDHLYWAGLGRLPGGSLHPAER